jgi:hypothetical protein
MCLRRRTPVQQGKPGAGAGPDDEAPASTMAKVVVGFTGLALVQTLHRYLTVEYGAAERHFDVRVVWEPLAEVVLGGGRLYLGAAVDNKPPLFELLNVALALTGRYYLLFLLLVGLANGAAAVLLYRFLRLRGLGREGVVAGLGFLTAVPLLNGTVVNVRSFALVGVLVALQVRSAWHRGAAIVTATLFSQYAMLAIPVFLYDGLRANDDRPAGAWTLEFGLAGAVVLLLSFGLVALLWGTESATAGVARSFGSFFTYSTKQGTTIRSPLSNPVLWLGYVYDTALRVSFVVIPFLVGLWRVVRNPTPVRTWGFQLLLAGLAVALTLSVFVRALPFYWLLPLPFYAALAAIELRHWYGFADPD